jgi:hypothetical protein
MPGPTPGALAALREARLASEPAGETSETGEASGPGLGEASAMSEAIGPGLGEASALGEAIGPGPGEASALGEAIGPGPGALGEPGEAEGAHRLDAYDAEGWRSFAAGVSQATEGEVAGAPQATGSGGRHGRVALIMGLSALAHVAALGVTAIVRPSAALTEGEIVHRDYLVQLRALAHDAAETSHDAPPAGGPGGSATPERKVLGSGPVRTVEAPKTTDDAPGFETIGPYRPNAEAAKADDGPVAIEADGAPRPCGGRKHCPRVFQRKGGEQRGTTPTIVALPGRMSPNGALHPDVVRRIVRQNVGRFRLCYEKGLERDPRLAGRVAVRFVIARDGSVASVANGGSQLSDAGVVACVVRSFGGLSFPRPERDAVTVVYPISFTTT